MTPTPWPVGNVPWPQITGSDVYATTRANLMKAAGLESVWAVGPAEGPIRFGSAKDPREMWTRLQTASPVPVYVHDLRWAQGRLAIRLARSLQKLTAGQEMGPEAARSLVDAESARLGIRLHPHADVLRQLDDEAPRAHARWHFELTGERFDPSTVPAPQTPQERAADRRKVKRAHDRQLVEIAHDAEKRHLERLIERHGSGSGGHS